MTEIIKIDPDSPEKETLEIAAETIRAGKLVVYPTETVYGLGADATSDGAVSQVFNAKLRPLDNPISVAVNSLEMARRVGEIPSRVEGLFAGILPGPLSFIVRARSGLSESVSAGTGKIAIRVPSHKVALKLIGKVGGPITSTSANVSGEPAPKTAEEALGQLRNRVDLILDADPASIGKPSTVIDVSGERLKVIREGPIPAAEVRKVLG